MKCSGKKRCFPLKSWAVDMGRVKRLPTFIYWCPDCAAWHLTRRSEWNGVELEQVNDVKVAS